MRSFALLRVGVAACHVMGDLCRLEKTLLPERCQHRFLNVAHRPADCQRFMNIVAMVLLAAVLLGMFRHNHQSTL